MRARHRTQDGAGATMGGTHVGKLSGEGIVGVLDRGLDGVPNGLCDLKGYLGMVVDLRRTLAEDAEAARRDGVDAEPAIDTLLDLEFDILRRAAHVPAGNLEGIIEKLTIWDTVSEDHDEGDSLENAVVRSVILDLRRLGGPATPGR